MFSNLDRAIILTAGALASGQHATLKDAIDEAKKAFTALQKDYSGTDATTAGPGTDTAATMDRRVRVSADVMQMARQFVNARTVADGQNIIRQIRENLEIVRRSSPAEVVRFAERIVGISTENQGRTIQGELSDAMRNWVVE